VTFREGEGRAEYTSGGGGGCGDGGCEVEVNNKKQFAPTSTLAPHSMEPWSSRLALGGKKSFHLS